MSAWVLPFREELQPATERFQRYATGAKSCEATRGALRCCLDEIHGEFSKHLHRHPDGRLELFEGEES